MNKILCLAIGAALLAPPHAQAQDSAPRGGADPVSGWPIPWQIARVSYTALRSEDIITAWVPGRGMVRGTQAAIEGIGKPLPQAAGPNRTLLACAEQVQNAARKAQAASVEWASASREHELKNGDYFGVVEFRITYPTELGYDVRDQPLVCVTKPDGSMIDAYMAENKDSVETVTRYTALTTKLRGRMSTARAGAAAAERAMLTTK